MINAISLASHESSGLQRSALSCRLLEDMLRKRNSRSLIFSLKEVRFGKLVEAARGVERGCGSPMALWLFGSSFLFFPSFFSTSSFSQFSTSDSSLSLNVLYSLLNHYLSNKKKTSSFDSQQEYSRKRIFMGFRSIYFTM